MAKQTKHPLAQDRRASNRKSTLEKAAQRRSAVRLETDGHGSGWAVYRHLFKKGRRRGRYVELRMPQVVWEWLWRVFPEAWPVPVFSNGRDASPYWRIKGIAGLDNMMMARAVVTLNGVVNEPFGWVVNYGELGRSVLDPCNLIIGAPKTPEGKRARASKRVAVETRRRMRKLGMRPLRLCANVDGARASAEGGRQL